MLSFRELETESSALASGLAGLGVTSGDRVVVLAFNSREFILTMIAVHKRGAIFVPINTELKGAFLEHQLKNTEPRVVIVDAALRAAFDSVDIAAAGVEVTVVIGGSALPLPGARAIRFESLVASSPRREDVVEVTPYTVCTIMFTSGTTEIGRAHV